MKPEPMSRRSVLGLFGALASSYMGCSQAPTEAPTEDPSPGPVPPANEALYYLSLREVAGRIQSKELSPVALTQAMLDRIAAIDPKLKSYATVMQKEAMAAAQLAHDEIQSGRYRGALHGVPVAVKDLCYTRGIRTMGGTRVYAGFVPDHDATVVAKLTAAGAVLLGKLNLPEGAMPGYNPALNIPVNPWREDVWAGVSSSGSGVATAAGLCYGAIGTDTGGSIRYPSAANGIVGLKPTYGRVSRYGVLPLAESLDHVGPMARSVGDVAVLFEAMAGYDPKDSTSLNEPAPSVLRDIDKGIRGLRIGFNRRYAAAGAIPEHVAAVESAVQALRQLGADIVDVQVPDTSEVQSMWFTLCTKEAAAAHKANFPSHADQYGPYFRDFLTLGALVSDADYARAVRFRNDFSSRYIAVLESVDALVCPALGAFPITKEAQYGSMAKFGAAVDAYYRQFNPAPVLSFFTMPSNLAGVPALTLPCGFSRDGLPFALQLLGPRLSEPLLCRIGQAYEKATEWHQRHPRV